MKTNLLGYCCYVLLFFCSFDVAAKWIQGESRVAIQGVELSEVRVEAIKNAVANAAFKGGTYISAEDVMLDGLLVSSKTEIRSEGQVSSVEILSERIEEQVLHVVVRVKIMPLMECKNQRFARNVMVTQFSLLEPEQASHGKIFSFGSQVSKRIFSQLGSFKPTSRARLAAHRFAAPNDILQLDPQQLIDRSAYLIQSNDLQYLVFGFIRDISLFEAHKDKLLWTDEVKVKRNFTLEVLLLDVIRQRLVFRDSYHGEANWDYQAIDTVDMNNSLFWRGDYGRMTLNVINTAVNDIADYIACLPVYLPILESVGDSVIVGLGSEQGLKLDDEFSVVKRRNLAIEGLGYKNLLSKQQQQIYRVTQIGLDTAKVELSSDKIQIPASVSDFLTPIE